jgi:hypothetical protein
MKKLILVISIVLLAISAYAQAPQKFNYQAIARNSTGLELPNQPIGVRLSIVDGSPGGTVVYQETHSLTTNPFGLFNLKVGDGTVTSGVFTSIAWGSGSKYIKTEIDPAGGTAYTVAGVSELISVPYALYANNSPAGPTGPQGPTGLPGVNGSNGLTGPQGIQGIQGPTGANGTNGLNGATGPQGLQGVTGNIGPVGPQGPTGANGINGINGATGANGTNGIDGATGATGPQGLQGPTGPTGAAGTNGVDGATGPQGTQGIQGPTGAAGTNGVNGATGPQGPTGTNGTNGATGPQGPTGANGLNGATGAIGNDGAVGPQGPIGPTGANGTNGLNGATGATGNDGAVGPQGPIGPTGANGTNGLNGATGATGNDGAVGPQGPTGPTGVGVTGPTGPAGSATVGGSNTQVLYNNNGAADGDPQFLFDNTTNHTIISGNTINPNAVLELGGTDGAFLPPRLTTTERDALMPSIGMQIFNTTTNDMEMAVLVTPSSPGTTTYGANPTTGTFSLTCMTSDAQVFIPTVTGTIAAIDGYTDAAPETSSISLYDGNPVTGCNANPNVLGTSATINTTQDAWNTWTFPTPVSVTAGQTYYLKSTNATGCFGMSYNLGTVDPALPNIIQQGMPPFGTCQNSIPVAFRITVNALPSPPVIGWVSMGGVTIGPTGPAGPTGPQGPTGAAGANGANGTVGPTGPQGPTGVANPARTMARRGGSQSISVTNSTILFPTVDAGNTYGTLPLTYSNGVFTNSSGSTLVLGVSFGLVTSGSTIQSITVDKGFGTHIISTADELIDEVSFNIVLAPSENFKVKAGVLFDEVVDFSFSRIVIADLTGMAGPAGADGSNGAQGIQGPTGPTGPTGVGTQGPTGATGANGTNGAQGIQGVTGPTGAGVTGPTGPTGPAAIAGNNADFKATAGISNVNANSTTTIVFPTIVYVEGGSYNNGTGEFTCTETGLYHFDVQMNAFAGLGAVYTYLKNNGVIVSQSITSYSGGALQALDLSADVQLTAGDLVTVEVNNTTSSTLTIFSGYFNGHKVGVGAQGATGLQGPTGATGVGLQGATGATGETGPTGPTGVGLQGPIGPTGPAGTFGGVTLNDAYNYVGSGAGRVINATNGAVKITGDDGFLVIGTGYGSGDVIEVEGGGIRMFFNPNKAAFRAGMVDTNEWIDANI